MSPRHATAAAFVICLMASLFAPTLPAQTAAPATQPAAAPTTQPAVSPTTAPAAATQPAWTPTTGANDYQVSDVRVQTLAGFTYLHRSFDTTFQTMNEPVGRAIGEMERAIVDGKLHPLGPMIFVYHDMKDPYKPFTLDVGFSVPDGSPALDGYQVGRVEPFKCATVLFSGPLSKVPDAFSKLMGACPAMGLRPTTTIREYYLYWEDPNSPNNVVQIQVGLEQ